MTNVQNEILPTVFVKAFGERGAKFYSIVSINHFILYWS